MIQTGTIGAASFDVLYEADLSTAYAFDVKATATGSIAGNLAGGPNDWGDFTTSFAATYFLDLGANTGAVADPWEFLVSRPIAWTETITTQRAGVITVGGTTAGSSLAGHLDVEAVPEPSSLLLLSAGLAGLAIAGRRRLRVEVAGWRPSTGWTSA